MRTLVISKVLLDPEGRVTVALWSRVDLAQSGWATPLSVVSIEAVVLALQTGDRVFALFPSSQGQVLGREFMVADYDGSRHTIALTGPSAMGHEVQDIDRLRVSDGLAAAN